MLDPTNRFAGDRRCQAVRAPSHRRDAAPATRSCPTTRGTARRDPGADQ
jgi:hypothetical protein